MTKLQAVQTTFKSEFTQMLLWIALVLLLSHATYASYQAVHVTIPALEMQITELEAMIDSRVNN